MRPTSPRLIASILMLAALFGCSAADPYIYKANEFDREAADFNTPVTDRDSLLICYNGWASSRAMIDRIAEEECRRFGKIAVRQDSRLSPCPLLVPAAAVFACSVAATDRRAEPGPSIQQPEASPAAE
jgi:hypothetical protein